MMNQYELVSLFDCALAAYHRACEKHPKFTDKVTELQPETVKVLVEQVKKYNNRNVPDFYSIIDEEIKEYIEASLLGDTEAAKRELLDCAAVLMREWERISQ